MEKTLCGESKNLKRKVNGGLDEEYVLMINELNFVGRIDEIRQGGRGGGLFIVNFFSSFFSPVLA